MKLIDLYNEIKVNKPYKNNVVYYDGWTPYIKLGEKIIKGTAIYKNGIKTFSFSSWFNNINKDDMKRVKNFFPKIYKEKTDEIEVLRDDVEIIDY